MNFSRKVTVSLGIPTYYQQFGLAISILFLTLKIGDLKSKLKFVSDFIFIPADTVVSIVLYM